MTHLINKLRFEMNCRDEDQAFQLRHSFADTLQEQIMRAVDEVCSAHVPEYESIRIDKIEIDVGNFRSTTFYEEFSQVFIRKFEEEIAKRISSVPVVKRKTSTQSSRLELFVHFMETGTIPWWAPELETSLEEVISELFSSQPEIVQQFFYKRKYDQSIWTRASFQFDNRAKANILSMFETLIDAKSQFETWLERFAASSPGTIIQVGSNMTGIANDIIIRNAPLIFRASEFEKPLLLRRLFNDHVETFIGNHNMASFEIAEIVSNITGEKAKPGIESAELTPTIEIRSGANKDDEEEPKRAVKEAGIIVLAPFLQTFFSKLKLFSQAGWESRDANWKAVHLMKYLSTGELNLPEYRMVLEKIICGLPISEPVPRDIILTDEEIFEADSLLTSVLEHWKALRTTSLAGLRETFFQRDGLLMQKENNWLLQVERKTVDVLLESLPWGYSAVKLPWNDYVIFTEW